MFKKNRTSLRRYSSHFFLAIALFTVLIGMFFLTSGFFFKEKLPVMNTNLKVANKISGNGEITAHSWLYDEEKNEMELVLVTKGIQSYENKIVFSAVQKGETVSDLNVETVYQENEIYILKIFGLDSDYKQVGLDVFTEKESESYPYEDYNGSEDEEEIIRDHLTRLYSDRREVDHKELKVKTEKEYAFLVSDVLLDHVNLSIENLAEKIKDEKEKKKEYEHGMKKNEEKMIYETESEKAETESVINGYGMKIEESKENIDAFEQEIDALNQKKNKLEQRKVDLDLS